MRIKRLLQEPILHFLLIGTLLFVVYGKLSAPENPTANIVVSAALIDEIAREHEARWFRQPTDQEIAGLIDSYVLDEILYREGMALGLDRDDPVIKRRIRQKFDVMMEEQSASEVPTDADLAAYLTKNAARFLAPGAVSFEQILFENSTSTADLERKVAAAKIALANGSDPAKLDQVSILPTALDNTALDLITRDFGAGFVKQIETVPLAQWSGPVTSSFGVHLIRVTARTPAALPPLEDIRRGVAREWENERRTSSRTQSYEKLRSNYTVVIEAKKLASLAAQ